MATYKTNKIEKTIYKEVSELPEINFAILGKDALAQAGEKIACEINEEKHYFFIEKNNKLCPIRAHDIMSEKDYINYKQKLRNQKEAKERYEAHKAEIAAIMAEHNFTKNEAESFWSAEKKKRKKEAEERLFSQPVKKIKTSLREDRSFKTNVHVSIDISVILQNLDNEYPETEEELLQKRRDAWL